MIFFSEYVFFASLETRVTTDTKKQPQPINHNKIVNISIGTNMSGNNVRGGMIKNIHLKATLIRSIDLTTSFKPNAWFCCAERSEGTKAHRALATAATTCYLAWA